MMLALLTYGRLDMYRSFIVTQGEFERYMVEDERSAINSGAQQWYDWTSLTQKNGGPKKPAPRDASPKLPISWLFPTEGAKSNPELDGAYKELLKKLINGIFGNQKKFKEALEKNSNLVDDLIQAMQAAGNKMAMEKKFIKTTDGLENLELDNQSLQDIYYWMIKGYQKIKPNTHQNQTVEVGDREEPADNQAEEHVHKEGTISLLDFLTVNPAKTKIRVFLASRPVLLTLFDPSTVDEIMQTRIELYHQVRNEKEHQNVSEQFKQKFATRTNVPEAILDFTVTATDPRNYEDQ